jgi:hypothetical protein
MSLTFLAILYCAVIANVLFPMVRFSSQTANYFFFALMQLIPLVIVALAFRRTGSRRYLLLAFGIQLENVGQEAVGPPSLPTEPDDGKRRFKSGI